MATSKKAVKPKAKGSSKTKSKSGSIGNTIRTTAKAALIPGYGTLSVAKKLDDYIQKKDPNLSKSKAYKAIKEPAKKIKSGIDYASDKVESFGKGVLDVVTNPGKYIEKGAAYVGKAAKKGMKSVDDYIEKNDPNLAKSKAYRAIKGVAKKAPKAIETGVGVLGKAAAMTNPVTGSGVAGREVYKGAAAAGRYAKKKIKEGAKAVDDYIEKNDPNLAKSKSYGAIKGTAKSALGVSSKSTAKKSGESKGSIASKMVKSASSVSKNKASDKSKAKVTGQSFLDVATGAKKTSEYSAKKPDTKTTLTKSAPTVSELWKQKTGTSWSEAKKRGLTDGSASANIALMKKLKAGTVGKDNMATFKKEMDQNVQDELSGKITYAPPTTASKSGAEKAADENKMKRGGMVRRRMQAGGTNKSITMKTGGTNNKPMSALEAARGLKKPIKNAAKAAKSLVKTAIKSSPEYKAYKAIGKGAKSIDDKLQKRYPNWTKKGTVYADLKKGVKSILGYKTGGMVNSNSKVSAIKSAGSKGVKTGANTRVSASKIARGRVGGTSTAPRTAVPKAKMGMSFGLRRKR